MLKQVYKELKSDDQNVRVRAFNDIYNYYFKLVCFCISQYIDNKEDIEEIADDTFINFFNNIDHLDETKNIKYYILTTAKNNAINALRRNNKYTTLSDEELVNIPYYDYKETNETLEILKKVLNEEELLIVINHLIYGYSFKEISSKQKISINTIMSKYRRAIKKAYKYLKELNLDYE